MPEDARYPKIAQLKSVEALRSRLSELGCALHAGHQEQCGSLDGLLVGLQLTHSGRFCKPRRHDRWRPRIAYHHPLLDRKFGIDPNDTSVVLTDDQVELLINDFVRSAQIA